MSISTVLKNAGLGSVGKILTGEEIDVEDNIIDYDLLDLCEKDETEELEERKRLHNQSVDRSVYYYAYLFEEILAKQFFPDTQIKGTGLVGNKSAQIG